VNILRQVSYAGIIALGMTFVIIVFVMAGVTKDNQGFLSAEKLSLIKKDSFFILMSRAAVVDFDALCGLTPLRMQIAMRETVKNLVSKKILGLE